MTPTDLAQIPVDAAGLRLLAFADWYSPASSGGAERAAWEVYRRLGAGGVRVRVVSAAHGPPHVDPGVDVDVVRGLDLSALAGGYFAPAPGAFLAGRRAVKEFRPDAVHVNTIHYTGSIAGAQLAGRHRLPLIVTVQLASLDDVRGRTKTIASTYERIVGGYILRRAARVLAVSRSAASHAVALGAPPSSIVIAPNGVDAGRFDVGPFEPSADPLVVAVGRLTANKGPGLLVDAAGLLAERGLRFRVAFVGDGPERRTLEARVRELGLGARVEFTGHVHDVERWMEKAEIIVRPSFTEGLALAVLEGMAAGRCNVVSDISANRELIRDGENGLTFRAGDPVDLARVLASAIEDPSLRTRLGRRARSDVGIYTWDAMAAQHAAALVELSRP